MKCGLIILALISTTFGVCCQDLTLENEILKLHQLDSIRFSSDSVIVKLAKVKHEQIEDIIINYEFEYGGLFVSMVDSIEKEVSLNVQLLKNIEKYIEENFEYTLTQKFIYLHIGGEINLFKATDTSIFFIGGLVPIDNNLQPTYKKIKRNNLTIDSMEIRIHEYYKNGQMTDHEVFSLAPSENNSKLFWVQLESISKIINQKVKLTLLNQANEKIITVLKKNHDY